MSAIELPDGTRANIPTRSEELLEIIASNTANMVGQLDMLIRMQCQQVDKKVIKKRLDDFDAARAAAQQSPPAPPV